MTDLKFVKVGPDRIRFIKRGSAWESDSWPGGDISATFIRETGRWIVRAANSTGGRWKCSSISMDRAVIQVVAFMGYIPAGVR